jgi:hypothetical protein
LGRHVRFNDAVEIASMNADGDTHEHVLRTLCDTTVDPQKVGPFQGLEAEADFANKSVNQVCSPHQKTYKL